MGFVLEHRVVPFERADHGYRQSFDRDCDIDIIVATNDADRSFGLAQEVYQQIMQWPRYGRTDYGRVIRIVGNPGFGKSAGGKQATGKKVKQYSASSFTVRAEDSLRVGCFSVFSFSSLASCGAFLLRRYEMAFNDDATLIATYGTLFYAPVGTALPASGAKAFRLNSDTIPAGSGGGTWKNLGHTSTDNKISFSFDGGDATTHSSWARKNLRTTYADSTCTITAKSLQLDGDTLKLIYNGNDEEGGVGVDITKKPQTFSLFLLAQESADDDSDIRFGALFRKVSVTFDGGPDFSGDDFVEQGMTGEVETVTGKKPIVFFEASKMKQS